jgi:hypothetical protein
VPRKLPPLLVLAALAVAGVALAATSRAAPETRSDVPPARVKALRETITSAIDLEWKAANTSVFAEDQTEARKAGETAKAALDAVEKEIRKAKAAGMDAADATFLGKLVDRIRGDDNAFLAAIARPRGNGNYPREILTQKAMPKKYKLLTRLNHIGGRNDLGPVTLDGITIRLGEAIEAELAVAKALEQKKDAKDELAAAQKSVDKVRQFVGAAHAKGLVSDAAADRLDSDLDDIDRTDESIELFDPDKALELLARAGGRKEQALATVLREIKIAKLNPPKGGKGPDCEAGTWTSEKLQILNPEQGKTTLYFFETPIPNADYYGAKKNGFTGGGCDHEEHMEANIDVYGSDGKLLSWTYQYGTFPTSDLAGGPVKAHSGADCPETVANSDGTTRVRKDCTVHNPSLSVALPKQGFVPPAKFTQDGNDFKFFSIVFSVERRLGTTGTPGSVYVTVTWRPK